LVPGAKQYMRTFLLGFLLMVITLGLYSPVLQNNLRKQMTDNTRLGSEPFRYDGVSKEVFWIWFKGVLLSLVTLGIYSFWMQARLMRYYLEHTHFSQARGSSRLSGGDLFVIFLVNLFGTTLSLGIAFPWLITYTLRTVLERVSFEGEIDFQRITQDPSLRGSAGGDALAGALDVGLGI
jgi:uncharacterized membrane protein YjgN (DUF898 family)